MTSKFLRLLFLSLTSVLPLLFISCGGSSESENGLRKIILQTDWYAQPEHGGFYQALVKGYYEEAGLDVEIVPGGPNALTIQKVAQGVAHFAIGRSDDIIIAASRQVPLMIQGALMQHDPQAILFHKESGIKDFKDLDGKTIMATPGTAFIRIMENTYDIKINVTPLDFGVNRFLADKDFIQQCFITNEPYYVAKEGANPGTLLLSESGFSPYRVWFSSRGFANANPEVVEAFNEASIRGWNDYLTGDRTEANAIIEATNPQQNEEFMAYVVKAMIDNKLVTGDPEKGEATGRITKERIQKQIDQLASIDMLESEVKIEQVLPARILETSAVLPTKTPGLHVKLDTPNGFDAMTVSMEQLEEIAIRSTMKFFETEDSEHDMTIVYLSDFVDTFIDDENLDFWIMNCGDNYQSNYYPEILGTTKPFFILTVDEKPLAEWLSSEGHPKEWGPHIVNIESHEGLLDPPHKNPWGVTEMIVTSKQRAYSGWGENLPNQEAIAGKQIFKNSCASCHDTGNGLMGGQVSTRNIQMLAVFAQNSEEYFRKMLIAPKETNPLAEKMPSYKHYTEKQVSELLAFMKSIPLS